MPRGSCKSHFEDSLSKTPKKSSETKWWYVTIVGLTGLNPRIPKRTFIPLRLLRIVPGKDGRLTKDRKPTGDEPKIQRHQQFSRLYLCMVLTLQDAPRRPWPRWAKAHMGRGSIWVKSYPEMKVLRTEFSIGEKVSEPFGILFYPFRRP